MEAKAVAKYVRVSPRKARVVIDQVRGKDVVRAREILRSRSALSPRPSRRFSTRPWQMPRTTMACPPTTWS